ncbi:MAG: sigma-70 family RNA polymerase sigma factor [Bacteroidota bacterium]
MAKNLCDTKHFEEVFEENNRSLTNFLYYQFGDLEKAKNFTQEAFIRLWSNCAKVVFEKARSYLFTTGKRLFLDEVAHEKVKLKFAERQKSLDVDSPSTDDAVRTEEFKDALEKAISSLSEKPRSIFLMNRIEKMKYSEIADTMDISIKTVEKHMSQSLIKIREQLNEFGSFKF